MTIRTKHIKDKDFSLFITDAQIEERIDLLVKKINADYAGKRPLFVCVLNGAFMFASDLIKKFDNRPNIINT